MLYGAGANDMAGFVSGHPLRDVPGTTYSYSSGDTMVQAAVATRLTKSSGADYLTTRLFGPLGIESAEFGGWKGPSAARRCTSPSRHGSVWRVSAGTGAGRRASAARGGWRGPPPAPVDGKHERFWGPFRLERVAEPYPAANGGKLPWPDAPEGTFAALGHWRQSIHVLPDHGVVVARTGAIATVPTSTTTFWARHCFVEAVPPAEPVASSVVEARGGARGGAVVSDAAAVSTEPSSADVSDGSTASSEAPAAVVASPRGFTPAAFLHRPSRRSHPRKYSSRQI